MLDIPFRVHAVEPAATEPPPLVLHVISADGDPEEFDAFGLEEFLAASSFDHVILSASRRSATVRRSSPAGQGLASASAEMSGWGRPGVRRVARAMLDLVAGQEPRLVLAHGFPFEAAVAGILARRFDVP